MHRRYSSLEAAADLVGAYAWGRCSRFTDLLMHSCDAETPKFLEAAADLAGPYAWGRYDLLLLPPSFPYGGMENPW